MKKLRINKPDLASLSSFGIVDKSRFSYASGLPSFEHQREFSQMQNRSAFASQSQHSVSQCISQSQTTDQFSQNSQEDFGNFNDQRRLNARGKDLTALRPSSSYGYPYASSNSRLAIAPAPAPTAHNLLQQISTGSWPENKCRISEELEEKLATLNKMVTGISTCLDSMKGDLEQLKISIKEAFSESNGSTQNLLHQQGILQSMLKQEDTAIKNIVDGLIKLPESLIEEIKKLQLDTLSQAIKEIPGQFTTLKDDLISVMHNELKSIISTYNKPCAKRGRPPKKVSVQQTTSSSKRNQDQLHASPAAMQCKEDLSRNQQVKKGRSAKSMHIKEEPPRAYKRGPCKVTLENSSKACKAAKEETPRVTKDVLENSLRQIPALDDGWVKKRRSSNQMCIHTRNTYQENDVPQVQQTTFQQSTVLLDDEEDSSLCILEEDPIEHKTMHNLYDEDEHRMQQIRQKILMARKKAQKRRHS